MKVSLELECDSSPAWVEAVLNDFNAFLQDHANCERKASAMAMSFVAKFPDRVQIIPELIETAIEELEHFQSVYQIMQSRGVLLPAQMGKDHYVQQLVGECRSDREQRFLDRLLLASIVECRGAERFRLVYEHLEDKPLKSFYHKLWASEAKHGNIFVEMALNYFDQNIVYKRLEELNRAEARVLQSLPIRPALH
jgi:tRNA-(ms[2]io[6]A)-hydroxylase